MFEMVCGYLTPAPITSDHPFPLPPNLNKNLAQFCLPRGGDGSHWVRAQCYNAVPPSPHFRRSAKVQGVTCASDGPAVNGTSPLTPSSSLINLLQWLTELRGIFCSLEYQLIVEERMELRSSPGKRCPGQDAEDGVMAFHSIQGPPL